MHTGNENIKLSMSTDDLVTFVENVKESSEKLRELINNYNRVAGYKVNIQESIAFMVVYSSNKQVEFKIKDIIPSILAPTPK